LKLLLLIEIEVSNRPSYRSNLGESPGKAGGLPYLFNTNSIGLKQNSQAG
jgi:hypothetical protein